MNEFEVKCLNNSLSDIEILFLHKYRHFNSSAPMILSDFVIFYEYRGLIFNALLPFSDSSFSNVSEHVERHIKSKTKIFDDIIFDLDINNLSLCATSKENYTNDVRSIVINQIYNFYEIKSWFDLNHSSTLHSEDIHPIVNKCCDKYLSLKSPPIEIFNEILSLCDYNPAVVINELESKLK